MLGVITVLTIELICLIHLLSLFAGVSFWGERSQPLRRELLGSLRPGHGHARAKHLNKQCLAGWGNEANVGKVNDDVPSCSHFHPGPAKFCDIWIC
jgi:hypothetical protein